MRWRLLLGGALLTLVLGTAYFQARKRGRALGTAVLLAGLGILAFAAAALVPRPPMTVFASKIMVVASVAMFAGAMAVLLARGFRE
jgi:hypothetical protein